VTASNDYGSTARELTITVAQATTTTSLTSSANPSILGQAVTFTATVSTDATGVPGPTGTVQFSIDGNPTGPPITLVAGMASFSTSTLGAGVHTVTASYSGDTGYLGSGPATLSQLVTYKVAVVAPPTKSSSNAGATVHVWFTLTDVDGTPIPDAEATSLVAGSCRVTAAGTGAQALASTCPSYDAGANRFSVSWKTDKRFPGLVTVAVTVTYPSTSATTVLSQPLQLT
jgi:hypothetical protein